MAASWKSGAGSGTSAPARDPPHRSSRPTVVPGIIDNHNHMVLMGNRPGYHTPLENAHSVADVRRCTRPARRGAAAGAWITTLGGFNTNHLYANLADALAACRRSRSSTRPSPNNPCCILQIGFSGPSTTNSAASRSSRRTASTAPINARDRRRRLIQEARTRRGDAALRQALLNPGGAAARHARRDRLRARASASPRTSTRARSRRPTRRPTAPRTRTTTRCSSRSSSCTATRG